VNLRSGTTKCYTAQPGLKTIALLRIPPTDRPLQSVKATASTQISQPSWLLALLELQWLLAFCDGFLKPFTVSLSAGL
jgi:hypothetical protein